MREEARGGERRRGGGEEEGEGRACDGGACGGGACGGGACSVRLLGDRLYGGRHHAHEVLADRGVDCERADAHLLGVGVALRYRGVVEPNVEVVGREGLTRADLLAGLDYGGEVHAVGVGLDSAEPLVRAEDGRVLRGEVQQLVVAAIGEAESKEAGLGR